MIKKVLSSLLVKTYIFFFEKRYFHGNRKYRYLLQKSGSSQLIVVFSGFPREGAKAGYNYIKTLKNVNCNKLFLLDNFGYKKRGAYYLAENGDFFIEAAMDALIGQVRKDLNIQETTYLGSSKGGYAALYYGIKNAADCIIAGSPQFYLGKYLRLASHKPILAAITGDDSAADAARLDRLLATKIAACNQSKKPKIYLHYSKNEPAYGEHIQDLVQTLHDNGFDCSQNIDVYLNHGDLVYYFPSYLLDVLAKMCIPGENHSQ